MSRDRREDEGQYYPGGKTIPVTPQHGGGSVVLDDTVTQTSQNGVKSSGIWSWVKGLLPAWLTPGYAEPATVASVNGKVDKISGKGLSSNDYTTAEKTKLAGIEAGAEVNPTPVAPSTEIAEGATADAKKVAEFVNSSINAMAAFYITKNATGDAFATKAELTAAIASGTFYNGGQLREPTKNDYLYVLADESATQIIPGVAPTTRYSFDGGQWAFQIVVNNTALTSAQVAAINSGITAALVSWLSAFKGQDTATTLASVLAAIAGKLSKSGDYAVMTGFINELRAYKIIIDDNYCAALITMSQNWMKLSVKQGGTFHFEIRDDDGYQIAMSELTPDGTPVATMGKVLPDATPEYTANTAYPVGAFVRYNGALYACHTAVTAGEPWNADKWTEMPDVHSLFSSGNTLGNAWIDSRLPYPLNTAGTIIDRAINVVTSGTFVIPEGFNDLLIRYTGTPTSLTFIGADASITDWGDDLPTDSGDYLITVSRIAADEAYIRIINLEVRA